ncbi:hypothetical protein DRJ17_03360 [Candidatus Woesearchaeota archaeon]|nr:MAG: hypothetical protein DRJ17_03360 [Candidatus Woesearchaeota archaeon]
MVLESLINPFKAERHPWEMFFIGFLYSSVAIFLALWIFKGHASLVAIFLTVLACVPFMINTIRLEQYKETEKLDEMSLLIEHSKALLSFMFLFIGILFSYLNWYLFLPQVLSCLISPGVAQNITKNLFSIQTNTLLEINTRTITASRFLTFTEIFLNNFKVLVFSLLFSFIYGAGAIFILTWNASVIAVAIGNWVKTKTAMLLTHNTSNISYLSAYMLGNLRFAIHGTIEILAYFVGGLAGGLISVAIINHTFGTKSFEKVIFDATNLILIAVLLLVVAALVEVFIIPVVF